MDESLALQALATLLSLWDIVEWLLKLPVAVFHGYTWLIRSGADFARSLFEDYGYWAVLIGTLAENTLLVGLIVPGALVLIIAGLAAHDGAISPLIAIPLGIVGTIIGDSISYCFGRYGWSRFGHGEMMRDFEAKVREPIMRRGAMFVLIYHFAGYTRLFGPAAAGFLKMPYRKWAPADYAGACLWVSSYFAIGYVLGIAGLSLDSTDKWFRYVEWGLLILVGTWGYFMYQSAVKSFGPKPPDETPAEPEPEPVTSE